MMAVSEWLIAIFAPLVFVGWIIYFAARIGERLENRRRKSTPPSADANALLVVYDAEHQRYPDVEHGATSEARESLKQIGTRKVW
jgi:hypothetical protein